MANVENIVRYSATELAERRARGESRSDLDRLRESAASGCERAALTQLEEDGISATWMDDAQVVHSMPKKLLSIRLDADVVAWFQAQGPGYQTRMNAVLKAYMKHAAA